MRHPKPSDGGYGMTVCIAAICDNGASIAVAMDRMISTSFTSGDIAKKGAFIHRFWMAMYAGNDIGRVAPIMEHAYAQLRDAQQHTNAEGQVSAWFVEQALCNALQYQLVMESTRRVLARYGLSMNEFLAKGRTAFGEAGFADVKREIDSVYMEMEFLLTGFAENGDARLFVVGPSDRGGPGIMSRSFTPTGFWAIGSGALNAVGTLMLREHTPDTPHTLGLYRVCEAKFMAERAAGVGRKTVVAVFRKDGGVGYIDMACIDHVKSQWERISKPRVPTGIEKDIGQALSWNVDGGRSPGKRP